MKLAHTGWVVFSLAMLAHSGLSQVLDKQKLLEKEAFWDNRDWDWYKANIPFLDTPDADINTTYYYRWELVTKHMTYGSPNSGYTFTEFIDRPFWSGAYGSISCPAGHQLYELRWLRTKRIVQDYARYWFRTPGAEPQRYSCWLADAVWALHTVHSDPEFTFDLLPDLQRNYAGWEKSHFVPAVGLFWQSGHDDGMEININSRQTKDTVRGAPGYRTTLNSYMWADAQAIANIARLAGNQKVRNEFLGKAASLKTNMQSKLWDPKREFFFEMFMQDEERDGAVVKAGTLTYQTGKYAGSPHGRELYNYVPWQFSVVDAGFETAWKFLMDREYFFADYGPLTTERHDPQFLIANYCCAWSGHSWPYATTQTLMALANLLNHYEQKFVTSDDYFRLLKIYTLTHQKNGRPYIAEGANPDTGSWEGYDSYNHSEHYFHSGYNDLIITGLIGLRPRADNIVEINPLVPEGWHFFALEDVPYHGHRLTILWDQTGQRYGRGAGLQILADGNQIVATNRLGKMTAPLPTQVEPAEPLLLNYAVNNDGTYFPKVSASYSDPKTPPGAANDGNHWYHVRPPNRWTCTGSTNRTDWYAVDFGTNRLIKQVALYILDDGEGVTAPEKYNLQYWAGSVWETVPEQKRNPEAPTGHRANVVQFPIRPIQKLRVLFTHARIGRSGLTELETWGEGSLPYAPPPTPPGNLAANPSGAGFPKATASFTSRFDKVEQVNDGIRSFRPNPHNRWTAYESTNASDWLEIDLGSEKRVGRVDLSIFNDGGGVLPPNSYNIQYWAEQHWSDAERQVKSPIKPTGSTVNSVTFSPILTSKVRIVFTHKGNSRSGVTEVEIWPE
ncbi:MAG: hypBA2 [Verrucomicrobiales bacterium]|nr:hypBA2 [Verrucomicrobiales bacterium]